MFHGTFRSSRKRCNKCKETAPRSPEICPNYQGKCGYPSKNTLGFASKPQDSPIYFQPFIGVISYFTPFITSLKLKPLFPQIFLCHSSLFIQTNHKKSLRKPSTLSTNILVAPRNKHASPWKTPCWHLYMDVSENSGFPPKSSICS